MSTILLPAVRRDTANLFHYKTAGVVEGTTTFALFGNSVGQSLIPIADVGLAVGDKVSASCELKTLTAGDTARFTIRFLDAAGALIRETSSGAAAEYPSFTRVTAEGGTVPANTVSLALFFRRSTGTGTVQCRKGMINRGSTAQPYDIPKRGAWAPITHGQLVRDNEQFMQRYLSGASQITTFPSRRWLLQFATHTLKGDELREWSLALDRLSDLTNVFRFVPPEYTGPSTGYAGPNPVVNGAGQTGDALICDGVDAEADIVGPGDFLSFEVTTPKGNTNVELHRVKSLAASDSGGNVTIQLTRPMRLSPADNAVVQIYSPIGQFRLAAPRAGQDIQLLRRASVSVEAEEAIYP